MPGFGDSSVTKVCLFCCHARKQMNGPAIVSSAVAPVSIGAARPALQDEPDSQKEVTIDSDHSPVSKTCTCRPPTSVPAQMSHTAVLLPRDESHPRRRPAGPIHHRLLVCTFCLLRKALRLLPNGKSYLGVTVCIQSILAPSS